MSDDKEQKNQEDFKAEWDKQKQETQQAEANYQKAEAEKQTVVAENAAIAEQLEANQLRMAELEAQVKAQKDAKTDPDFDPDLVDKNVIRELTQARADRKELLEKVANLEGKATAYEQTEQKREAKTAEDAAVNKICGKLDEEFGPQFRNDAIALATKLVKEGKEKPVADGIDATHLMRKCYTQLSKEANSDKSERTDTGDGGTVIPPVPGKAGTTEEVLADMRQNKSWLSEPLGTGEPDIF